MSDGAPEPLSLRLTPAELKSARQALGLSVEGFARAVRVANGRTVRRWERGERDIPGSVARLLELAAELSAVRRRLQLWGAPHRRGRPPKVAAE